MGISRYHLLIEGRVQGVGYRMATQMAARQFALTGWVRNLSDGRVECIAEGLPEQLNQLVDWAKKGPHFAEVTHVSVTEQTATEEFTSFEIY